MASDAEIDCERDVIDTLLAEKRNLEIMFLATVNAYGGTLIIPDAYIIKAIPEHFELTRFNDAARGCVEFTVKDKKGPDK